MERSSFDGANRRDVGKTMSVMLTTSHNDLHNLFVIFSNHDQKLNKVLGTSLIFGVLVASLHLVQPGGIVDRQKLLDDVKSVISQEILIPLDDMRLDTKLLELAMDSLDIFKVALALEDFFGIILSTEEIRQIETVEDIIKILEIKRNFG